MREPASAQRRDCWPPERRQPCSLRVVNLRGNSPPVVFRWWFVLTLTCLAGMVTRAPAATGGRDEIQRLHEATCRALLAEERDLDSIRRAALHSRAYFSRLPAGSTHPFGSQAIPVADLQRAVEVILEVSTKNRTDWTRSICRRLSLYGIPRTPALLTGYYQPVLAARTRAAGAFRHPLYGLPSDLTNPYYTRRQIEAGAIAGKAPVLAWLNDPVDAFFLQIQGAGILQLPDGMRLHVGYAGSNGRAYRSIGKLLIEQGKLKPGQASMERIKDYLHRHPEELDSVLQANERYIFFRTVRSGPIGSIGELLTAGRSIAADAAVYPAGALGFLTTRGVQGAPPVPHSRVVAIQDAGAAITGPGRFDLFVGTGAEAGAAAGRMKTHARFYLLLPAGVP